MRNLPNLIATKDSLGNNWEADKIDDVLVGSKMLELIKKFKLPYEIHEFWEYTDKIENFKMFGWVLEFMKRKNEQDTLKKNKDSRYNPALRECLKLAMNTVSGKVAEGLHLQTTEIGTIPDFVDALKNNKNANIVDILNNGWIQYTFEKDIDKEIKRQKPIALSFYIYEYSRAYMFEHAYSKIGLKNLLYTDTDAAKVENTNLKSFLDYATKTKVPHWEEIEEIDEAYKSHVLYDPKSKVFGSFENELGGVAHDEFYCLQKKFWVCLNNGKIAIHEGKLKLGSKGVNPKSVLISFETKKKAQEFTKKKTIIELYNEFNAHNIGEIDVNIYKESFGDEAVEIIEEFAESLKIENPQNVKDAAA